LVTITEDEQGMNGTLLEEMLAPSSLWSVYLQGIMIVRNGYVVLEEYPDSDFNESSLSNTWSVTKSIISILVGIALEEGYLSSLDETMVSFFPDRIIANRDSQKESITLRHLLTMKSGLQWNPYTDPGLMRESSDWVQYALDKPMSSTPGEIWTYNSGGAHILSAILLETIGMTPSTFADIHLFQPLGIDEYEWEVDPQGLDYGANGLQLTVRDMAKIGFLFLNNGTWDAEQIVSRGWVENSTKVYTTECGGGGFEGEYGYLWWIKSSYNAYCAYGSYGQWIWVFPDYNLIFVTKSTFQTILIDNLITEYILPSLDYIQMTTTTTTTTTTPVNGSGEVDIILIALAISGVVVIIAIVVFIKRW